MLTTHSTYRRNKRTRTKQKLPNAKEARQWWSYFLVAFKHPAVWLTMALVCNVLEGAFRKWIPGFSGGPGRILAYFSKDIFYLIGVVLVSFRPSWPSKALSAVNGWEIASIGFVIFGGIVSLSSGFNPTGAVFTLRSLVILPFVAYFFVSKTRNFPLLGFALIAVSLTLINAPLALLQNSLPSNHILNQYAAEEVHITEVAFGVRATGTFAYITGLGLMASLGIWSGLIVISLGEKRWMQVMGGLGVLGGLACAFASISRGTLVTALAMVILWAFSSIRATRVFCQMLVLIAMVGLVGLLTSPGLVDKFIHAGEGTIDRFESAGDDNMNRAVGQFSSLFKSISESPFGNGIGTEQVAGNYVTTGVAGLTTYETQFPRIVAEIGVLGFLGFSGMVFSVVWALQNTRGAPRQWRWNLVVTATQVYLLGQFYLNAVFNHTGSAFIWIVSAAVLAASPTARTRGLKRKNRRVNQSRQLEATRQLPSPQPHQEVPIDNTKYS